MKLKQQLQTLQEIKASDSLKNRIHETVNNLPAKSRRLYFPLVTFQAAFALVILLIVVGIGSGLVAGVKQSHPGTLLYPVKELIQKKTEDKGSIHQQVVSSPVPTATPKPSIQVIPSGQPNAHTQVTPSVTATAQNNEEKHNVTTTNKEKDFSEEAALHVEKILKRLFPEGDPLHHDNGKDNSSHQQQKEND